MKRAEWLTLLLGRSEGDAEFEASLMAEEILVFLIDKASERRMRLFLCACVRLLWDQQDDESRALTAVAIEMAEEFADEKRSLEEAESIPGGVVQGDFPHVPSRKQSCPAGGRVVCQLGNRRA